ncbi:hypothetical protein KUCAC02_026608, partial [Chaenocephalus aceratus]
MDPQNNMENEAKMFLSHAKTLRLHTGNIVNRSRLKKKCPCSPSEELQDCIQAALSDWKAATKPPSNDFPDTLDCSIPQPTDAIPPEEREELRVSVKLFLDALDSVIIAPTWPLAEGENQSLAHLQPAWEELESLVRSQRIAAIGTSDLDKDLLEQLYTWAQVKPSSNQVNLASCCVMPPDLTAFAKEFDIQLLTHNDPKEMVERVYIRRRGEEFKNLISSARGGAFGFGLPDGTLCALSIASGAAKRTGTQNFRDPFFQKGACILPFSVFGQAYQSHI